MLPVRVEGLGPLSYPRLMRSLKAGPLLSTRSGQLQLPSYSSPRVRAWNPSTKYVSGLGKSVMQSSNGYQASQDPIHSRCCFLSSVLGMWGQGCLDSLTVGIGSGIISETCTSERAPLADLPVLDFHFTSVPDLGLQSIQQKALLFCFSISSQILVTHFNGGFVSHMQDVPN